MAFVALVGFLFLAEVARETFLLIFFADFGEAKSSSDELSGHCTSEVLGMVNPINQMYMSERHTLASGAVGLDS